MNSNYNVSRTIEIDLVDLMWKLLMQWKAILIVCIVMGLLVPGIKYLKDNSAYKAELSAKKEAEAQASIPTEERIEDALKALPADQRSDVMFVVQQQDMIDKQKDYLNHSILLNTDPSCQRQLAIKYVLKSNIGTNMRTLADTYSTCLRRSSSLESLREIISPEAKIENINELIDTKNKNIRAGDASSALYTIIVVLPDGVDEEKVLSFIDSEIKEFHIEINDSAGEHSIQRVNVEDQAVFNKDIVERRNNLINAINNLSTTIETAKGKLNAEQQVTFETISAIMKSERSMLDAEADTGTESYAPSTAPQEPGFSKKYALLGFLLGAFLYAGIFIVMLILKKKVVSARSAQRYTNTRILGEVYQKAKRSGLSWLITSDLVAKYRYKGKLDADKQIASLASTIDALCTHHCTNNLSLILCGVGSRFSEIVDRIEKTCNPGENKYIVNLIDADKMEEKTLDTVTSAIYTISSETKVDTLGQLMSLCKDYDVKPLGSIYLEEL